MTLCPRCGEDHPQGSDQCPVVVVPFDADPLRHVLLADKYRLLALLGQGGMGRVYEGLDLSSNRLLRSLLPTFPKTMIHLPKLPLVRLVSSLSR